MQMWNASPSPTNFEGCLSNLFYNGQILDLYDSLLSKNTAVGCQHTEGSCRTLNCSGHGICQADLTDTPPWCWCDAGWSGPNCSEPTQPVTFLPHSYIKFALSFETDRFMTLVQLRFRTEEPEGELFRLSDQYTNEYAVLEIKQRNVYFKYNLNSKNIEERYTCLCYVTVDDGNWHTVKVSRYGSLSTLQLDDGEFTRYNQTSVFEGHQWLVIDKQEGIHAGGKAEYTGMDTLEIYADFKNGCVDDVRLDGRALPLPPSSNVTQWGQVTMALNLENGCGFSSGCNFIICTEPVKCSDKLKQTNCMCSDEKVLATKSKDCATETCERKSCIGSDECLYQNTKFHYNCQCPDGETGMNCKFLGDKSAFSLTAWSLTALLLISVLILVLVTSLIGYKYFFSIHRRTEVKDDIQENVMNYADDAGSGNGGTCGIKPEKTSIKETEASVSMELHDLKGSSGPDTKYLMEHKNKIDTDLLSENRDELNVYIYEGGGTAASSFSSLCAGFQEKEPDAVNFAQRGSFCILLEKQCQTEL
ncbi:putative neural-cadherin 2 [Schistocerca gregaria]|uniref:putative neural-cadherin 2 n=1 Tax=Schistocerca gregaria TaxID=7010 RepID=UPI00211EE419|nr:putative neural-cadherin 2 [Schistocerca gregaria]